MSPVAGLVSGHVPLQGVPVDPTGIGNSLHQYCDGRIIKAASWTLRASNKCLGMLDLCNTEQHLTHFYESPSVNAEFRKVEWKIYISVYLWVYYIAYYSDKLNN